MALLVAVSGCQLTLVSWTLLLFLDVWLVTNDLAGHRKCCPESSSFGPHMTTRWIQKSGDLNIWI